MLFSCGAGWSEQLAANAPKSIEKTVEFPNKSTDEFFVSFNTWMANYFNGDGSGIDFSDREAGMMVGNYVFDFKSGIYYYHGQSTMNIDVKDGRVKILFLNPQI